MRDVSPCAVPGEEHAPEVRMRVQPLVRTGPVGVGGDPLDGDPGVVVRNRDRVLRGKTVVHGDGDDAGLGD